MSSPPDLDALSSAELKALVIALLERVAALERTVATQRDEIARLKGVPGRPVLKPSGMENATQPKPTGGKDKHGRGGKRTARRVIHEDRVVTAAAPSLAFHSLREQNLGQLRRPARGSRATRISWCRIWCCVRTSCATGASAG